MFVSHCILTLYLDAGWARRVETFVHGFTGLSSVLLGSFVTHTKQDNKITKKGLECIYHNMSHNKKLLSVNLKVFELLKNLI